MPELPEVQTIVNGLKSTIIGKKITDIEIKLERQLKNVTVTEMKQVLINQTINNVERFGKYILFSFSGDIKMVVHLRMTGKFIFEPSGDANDQPHIRMWFDFEDRTKLFYQDLRTFGTFSLYNQTLPLKELNQLGLDPVNEIEKITASYLMDKWKKKSLPVKSALLEQSVITGLGNIYVCEILFDAGLSPFVPAGELDASRLGKLIESISKILRLALEKNGTSISDYRTVEDKTGSFQDFLSVYQREGKMCKKCKQHTIIRIKQNQRSTFYCPICQALH